MHARRGRYAINKLDLNSECQEHCLGDPTHKNIALLV